jgi:ribosomal protein L31E
MSKEAELRALRELTGAQNGANAANSGANSDVVSKPDDIAVMKYLDGLRRKATTIEEVEIIDAIVKSLFHEGINKITGRVHERVHETSEAKPDRRAYQRDLMRKRRAKGQASHTDP